MTQPSLVTIQRPGRSPLRSSVAPMSRPSVKVTDAGPSHGSIRQRVVAEEALQLSGRSRALDSASGISIIRAWGWTGRP